MESRFKAEIEGRTGSRVSRSGTKEYGIGAHIYGENLGIHIIGRVWDGEDQFEVRLTKGDNHPHPTKGMTRVLTVRGDKQEVVYNAPDKDKNPLIAAASELFEALSELIEGLEQGGTYYDETGRGGSGGLEEEVAKARQAIAKAEGRENPNG